MTRYIWDSAVRNFVNPETGEQMEYPEGDGVCAPRVKSDIEPYKSPIDGRLITSASERRDDLKRNNCVPYEPIGNAPKGLTNPKFAKKYNAMHLLTEEARDRHKIARKAI